MIVTKNANIAFSMTWKQESRKLFDQVQDKQDFYDAAMWCGKLGSVTRTVTKHNQRKFTDWLYVHLNAIKKGTFVIAKSRVTYLGMIKDDYPKSWISKICHIINPHAYPLIDDKYVNAHLKQQGTTFKQESAKLVSQFANLSDSDIYLHDSTIWAK